MSQRQEAAWGLCVALLVNLAAAAVLNNPLESSTRTWLVVLGATNELIGVLMIASPELLPYAARAGRKLLAIGRRVSSHIAERVRRLLHLPQVHRLGIASELGMSGSAVAEVIRKPPEDMEEVVTWLVRHDKELRALQQKLNSMSTEWQSDIQKATSETEDYARSQVKSFADRHLPLRLLGVGFLVLGVVLGTIGNLV